MFSQLATFCPFKDGSIDEEKTSAEVDALLAKRLQDMSSDQLAQIDNIDATLIEMLNNEQLDSADVFMQIQTTLAAVRTVVTQLVMNHQLSYKAKRDILAKQQQIIDEKNAHVHQLQQLARSRRTTRTPPAATTAQRTTRASSSSQRDIKLVSSSNKNFMLWNVRTGKPLATISAHEGIIDDFELVAPNRLATASADKTIRIWNMETGECVRTLAGHVNGVRALQLVAKNLLASGSYDRTIKLWNLNNGGCVHTLVGHGKVVTALQSVAAGVLVRATTCFTIICRAV